MAGPQLEVRFGTFIIFFKCLFILRERKSASRGGAEREREGERENPKEAPCCQHREPHAGLELTSREIMTRLAIKSWMLNPLSHPGAPGFGHLERRSFWCFIMLHSCPGKGPSSIFHEGKRDTPMIYVRS